MTGADASLDAAIRDERYEAAALRLLLGLLTAIDDAGPRTRDELVRWLTVTSTGEHP